MEAPLSLISSRDSVGMVRLCVQEHEVQVLKVFPCVVLRLPVVPDLINNRLPVLFLNDYFREIFDKNAELLECHPCNIVFDGFQKELLKASTFRCLNLVSEIRKDQV